MTAEVVPMDKAGLERRADRIRGLMADMTKDIMAIGAELIKARELFPVGPNRSRLGWSAWIKREFDMRKNTANAFIRTFEKFGDVRGQLPTQTVLRYLGKESVSDAARTEVILRHNRGEKVTLKKAKRIVQRSLPSPAKANEQAMETGKPVQASDGYVYFGASKEQVSAAQDKRTVVYSLREAVATIYGISHTMTAEEFLSYAAPHQLLAFQKNDALIDDAAKWLGDLQRAWGRKKLN